MPPTITNIRASQRAGTKQVDIVYDVADPDSSAVTVQIERYDMAGNVWEWCWDWADAGIPSGQTNPCGAATGTYRVLRGGKKVPRVSAAPSAKAAPRAAPTTTLVSALSGGYNLSFLFH